MIRLNVKAAAAKAAAIGAALAVAASAIAISSSSPAQADPQSASALVVVGSDTTQSVMNAMAGFENGINYTPIQSDLEPTKTQLVSWNALNPDPFGDACITPKVKAATIYRSNGSSEGRRALSRGIQNAQYGGNTGTAPATFTTGTGGVCGSPGRSTAGIVDIARSSSGITSAGTALTYIPFGRDALSFAYYRPAGAPASVPTLTSAQLQSMFGASGGPTRIGGVRYIPCGIQLGSGTYQSWRGMVAGGSDANDQAATLYCQGYTGTVDGVTVQARLQEHDGDGLKYKGDLAVQQSAGSPAPPVADGATGNTAYNEANSVFIVGYSAGVFVSQANGVAIDRIPQADIAAGKWDLGRIDALGASYTVTDGVYSPAAGQFSSDTYGRDVYNVVDTNRLQDEFGDLGMKGLLVSTDLGKPAVPGVRADHVAAICSDAAQETVNKFGFLSIPTRCGSTQLTGALVVGSNPLQP
mgnify:CR=1 FL=1